MSLENLLAIQRLVRHEAGRSVVLKLVAAAERNLADARVTAISAENRFDAAYKAILQCALAALAAKGYRTSTSQPGHHQTAIQTLPLTLAVDNGSVIVLDALRKQRHLTDYTGDGVSKALLAECIAQAESLLHHARATLGDP
ncbi:DNA-binding protein [Accumulibacter sp.]|jgi:uncharacterized protein (UPF0332 family)|uniref:DNA-binding protein n=1 Tax=Accumulibacter sp. TaxID=2053492 RepID=UPI001AC69F20|nr:DNA-binding protein [Accumulibacter sp.]MBN8451679.1 DNA-binding protein [Accumulibacter sp.]